MVVGCLRTDKVPLVGGLVVADNHDEGLAPVSAVDAETHARSSVVYWAASLKIIEINYKLPVSKPKPEKNKSMNFSVAAVVWICA